MKWKVLLKVDLKKDVVFEAWQYWEKALDLFSSDKAVLSMELKLRMTGLLFLDIDFNTYLSDITAKRSLSKSSLASNRMTLMDVDCL